MINKLQAVNEVLQRVGKLPVKTLDTGGTSTHAHVERVLDQANDMIQSQGWAWNEKVDVPVASNSDNELQVNDLEPAAGKGVPSAMTAANPVVVTMSSNPFKTGDTVYIENVVGMTQVNKRTFTVTRLGPTQFELDGEDGTMHTAFSVDSGATVQRVHNIYHVDTSGTDNDKDYSRRGARMFDNEDRTFTITGTTKLQYVYQFDWEDLPVSFQKWIIAQAAFDFNRSYVGNAAADQRLTQEILDSRRQATREEIRAVDTNVLDQQPMRQVRGRPRMQDRSVF